MALITCPECNRPNVSDTADACPDCGYSIKNHFEEMEKTRIEQQKKAEEYQHELDKVGEPKRYKVEVGPFIFGFLIIAIGIGGLIAMFVMGRGSELMESKSTPVYLMMGLGILVLCFWMRNYIKVKKEYEKEYHLFVTNPDEYRRNAADKAIKRKQELAQMEAQRKVVKCPRCGSTNIQVVRRNWSIITGIMTNKVDRVCANCKTQF